MVSSNGDRGPGGAEEGSVAYELAAMAERDQQMRRRGIAFDPAVDHQNLARLKEIVDEIGWPTKSKVGTGGATCA